MCRWDYGRTFRVGCPRKRPAGRQRYKNESPPKIWAPRLSALRSCRAAATPLAAKSFHQRLANLLGIRRGNGHHRRSRAADETRRPVPPGETPGNPKFPGSRRSDKADECDREKTQAPSPLPEQNAAVSSATRCKFCTTSAANIARAATPRAFSVGSGRSGVTTIKSSDSRNIAAVKKNFAEPPRSASSSVVAATTNPPQSAAVDIIGMVLERRRFAEQLPRSAWRPASSAPTSNPATIAAALEPSPTPIGISFSISM